MKSYEDSFRTEGFVNATGMIQEKLMKLREELLDEESRQKLDKVLDEIFRLKMDIIK